MQSFTTILGAVILAFGVAGFLVNKQPQVELLYSGQDLYTLFHLVFGVILILIGLFSKKGVGATAMDRGRAVRFWSGSLSYIVVFVAILVSANYLVHRYDKRWDLTEQGVYSLAEQSRNAVGALQKPLKIIGFDVRAERQADNLRDLLELYRNANPGKVTTEFVNPRSRPELVERLGMKGGNLIYLEYGDKGTQGSDTSIARLNEATEESITNGILKLTGGDAKKVYYLTGHKEPGIGDVTPEGLQRFSDALKDEHLELVELSLAQSKSGGVPEDAASVLWINPQGPLLPGELDALKKYLDQGGRMMVATEARSAGVEEVRALASHAGISIGNDIVLDVVTQLFAGPSVALQFAAFNFGSHEITRRFGQRDVIVVDGASSVKGGGLSGEAGTYTDLVRTSENGWGETNLDAIFNTSEPSAEFGEGDVKGPVSLAVAYEKKLDESRATRLVVFGDSSWMTNGSFKYPAHRDLALNSIAWLNGQAANISIRPRTMRSSITPISADTFRNLLQVGFIVPELIVLFGLFVWWRRRTVGAR